MPPQRGPSAATSAPSAATVRTAVTRGGVTAEKRAAADGGSKLRPLRETETSTSKGSNAALPASVREESEVFAALQAIAVDQTVLLVIDDAWSADQTRQLNCIDPRTPSRTVVTTRISGLLPGVDAEFALGLLAADAAIIPRGVVVFLEPNAHKNSDAIRFHQT